MSSDTGTNDQLSALSKLSLARDTLLPAEWKGTSRVRRSRAPLIQLTALVLVLCTLSVDAFQFSRKHSVRHVSRTSRDPFQSLNEPLFLVSRAPSLSHHAFTKHRPTFTTLFAAADNEGDEAEWKAIVAAFKLYKAAYGDLKVPQRFVVPNMKPWPVKSHNLKLGKVVANIRATGRYLQGKPERRTLLEEMGFIWRVRETAEVKNVSWQQVRTALAAYRQIVPDKPDVPPTFTVPEFDPWPESVRGLPLGRYLPVLETKVFPKNEKAREAFLELGFGAESASSTAEGSDKKLTANDIRFQKVFAALKKYKEVYGDLLVPQPFVVPEGDEKKWPEETWGLRLGARVNAIRSQGTFVNNNPERRKLLDDLGFIWSPEKTARGRRGRRSKAEEEEDAGSAAATAAMDSLLDGSFDFSSPEPGDESLASPGGSESGTSPSWDLKGAHMPETVMKPIEDTSNPASEEYLPPRTLEDSMKEATERAKECGIIEGLTPSKRVIKGKREKNIPWFNDDFGEDFVFEDVVEALTVYKSMYGDFTNLTDGDGDFVVPAPKEITGFLNDESGSFDSFEVDASSRAAAAIAQFEEEEDQPFVESEPMAMSAATGATATASTSVWPEHLAGMGLGHIVRRIRDGSLEVKHLPERKAKLDSLDFDWGDEKYFIDIPFEKAMCAMYAYYLIRGDMFVYEDFIMPDEDPWPESLAGYELGQAVKRLRELQNFLEAYHPEKVSLLRMIDFVWFSETMALPLDPNEPEMTPETLLLSALGHPDYAKMIDIPMGLPDKIINDGPFMETDDDPKLWWRKWHNWEYVEDYWYQQGRRDNAYVLRGMGYPQMAAEHEAKYGPGLFSQINATMQDIEDNGIEGKSTEEKKELLQTLSEFRQEILGCTDIHPQDRDQLLLDMDNHMLDIMKDKEIASMAEEDEAAGEEYEEGEEYEYEEEEYEEDEYEEEYEEEEVDIEDELGLGQKQ